MLRLVVAHNGRHPVYLVTSLVSATDASDRQILELYARRWGIELFYRTFQQTFGRRKLRSTTPDNAEVEMQWSLLGRWALSLSALVQATKRGVEPRRLSAAQLLLAFRRMLRDDRHPVERGHSLCHLLGEAVIDCDPRQNKASRNSPRKKRESPPGKPQLVTADKSQRQRATLLGNKV